jgi:hypothetical protein
MMYMINLQIHLIFSFDHNEFSIVAIDIQDNWNMKQVHEIYPNQETMLPNRIFWLPHCLIHLYQ